MSRAPAIHRQVNAFGKPRTFGCDAQCGKAWGINHRPKEILGDGSDPDDCAYLADGELGDAPVDPGTYEGGHAKPVLPDERLNRWCFRECERSACAETLEGIVLPDLGRRLYNRLSRQREADARDAAGA